MDESDHDNHGADDADYDDDDDDNGHDDDDDDDDVDDDVVMTKEKEGFRLKVEHGQVLQVP